MFLKRLVFSERLFTRSWGLSLKVPVLSVYVQSLVVYVYIDKLDMVPTKYSKTIVLKPNILNPLYVENPILSKFFMPFLYEG